ncbi:sigma factor-like helix-turn-helix DNA-binding protein [Actinomadura kijaniata]|uniref:sigma factor-like helix-turn-helix DNA-binding protein n=1 Tax=Actinomadura kijaniata TaxID=46161 RepID=UPI0008308022|nr:sigma factor-like helix-turn-helix DNA-binding protein [Actinomadura kijaniata]
MALREKTNGLGSGVVAERAVMVRALRALPAAHQEILDETLFRRRSVNEAAAALGVPVETVKVRVYHALRALRIALDTPRA